MLTACTQVSDLHQVSDKRWKGTCTDGGSSMGMLLTAQVASLATDGKLRVGDTVSLKSYTVNLVNGKHMAFITDLDVLASEGPSPATPQVGCRRWQRAAAG